MSLGWSFVSQELKGPTKQFLHSSIGNTTRFAERDLTDTFNIFLSA
jgi:hypothetical protein